MTAVASYTVDRAAAATLREWLFDPAIEKRGESYISKPLAEVAAAIDSELHEQAESIEFGASTNVPTSGPRHVTRPVILMLVV